MRQRRNVRQTGTRLTPSRRRRGTWRRNNHCGCKQEDKAMTVNKEHVTPPLAAQRRRPSTIT